MYKNFLLNDTSITNSYQHTLVLFSSKGLYICFFPYHDSHEIYTIYFVTLFIIRTKHILYKVSYLILDLGFFLNVLSMFRLLKTFLDVIKNPAQSSIDVNKFITHLSLIVFKYEKTHIYVFSSSSKKHKLFALCTPSHAYVVSYDYLTC